MAKITSCLWFDGRAEEAANFYVTLLPDSRVWDALTADGGEPGPCGWLKDRFGVSWQIVPRRLIELVEDPDRDRARRAMEAMLKMGKLDVAGLERAADAA